MIHTAKLYARFSDPDGKYPRVPVKFHGNGKAIEPKPPAGSRLVRYQIRVAGKFIGVGDQFDAAVSRLRQEEARLRGGVSRDEALAVETPEAAEAAPQNGPVRIVDAANEFIREMRTLDRKRNSVLIYANALRDFQKSCRKQFMNEIDRKDILNFMDWMKENMQVRVPGSESRTYKNKLNYLGTFLARHGIQLRKKGNAQNAADSGLLFRSDWPKVMKKKPKKYDKAEIELLMAHADVDEEDYLRFLLSSGFRDEEVEYLLYSDFNFRHSTVMVQAKPQFGWKPKDYEERTITLPDEVAKRMKDRMDRPRQYRDGFRKSKPEDLVFPNSEGKPDEHLIYRLHAVAKKAGLDLKGKRAGHMFRKTAGSRVAKKLGLPVAMEFLGHSNIETTALYLAADTSDHVKERQAANEMYEAGD